MSIQSCGFFRRHMRLSFIFPCHTVTPIRMNPAAIMRKAVSSMEFIEHFSKKFSAPMPLPAHMMPAKTTMTIAK